MHHGQDDSDPRPPSVQYHGTQRDGKSISADFPQLGAQLLRTEKSAVLTSEQASEGKVEAGAVFQDRDHLTQ